MKKDENLELVFFFFFFLFFINRVSIELKTTEETEIIDGTFSN